MLFYIVGAMASLIFSFYEEISGKKYEYRDEFRLMMMTAFIIIAILGVLLSIICICGKLWDCVSIGIVIAFLFGVFAFIAYYTPKK